VEFWWPFDAAVPANRDVDGLRPAAEDAGVRLVGLNFFALRALEVYEVDRLDFAEAYLVASAEASGVGVVASFDRTIDRVSTVRRVQP
jgi:predicted nucleic acid-binding protein